MFTGFRGAHLPIPPANPLDLPCNSAPDPFDTADFEVPHDKSMVEAFMAGLAKEADNKYVLWTVGPACNPARSESDSLTGLAGLRGRRGRWAPKVATPAGSRGAAKSSGSLVYIVNERFIPDLSPALT